MTEGKLYQLSCRAARDLLRGLERSDVHGVRKGLGALRHYLTLAETIPAAAMRGDALYRREQLEALAGISERLSGSAGELDAIGANHALLKHLVSRAADSRPSSVYFPARRNTG